MPFLPFAATIGAALGGSATLGGIALAAGAAIVGTGIASSVQQGQAQKKAANAVNDANFAQATEKQRLEDLVAGAPEKERQSELDKRRKRVKTLLTSQEDTGMATVGTKSLLGG
jgi:uncharacterized protein HemX